MFDLENILPEFLKCLKGGAFTFPTNSLTKNAKRINGNRKTNKGIPKSDRTMYTKTIKVNKAADGIKFNELSFAKSTPDPLTVEMPEDITSSPKPYLLIEDNVYKIKMTNPEYQILLNNYSSYLDILDEVRLKLTELETKINEQQIVKESINEKSKRVTYPTPGFEYFSRLYDEVEKEMPEAKQYRNLLTVIAKHESNFKPAILNLSGAPAYGYFLFMEDGVKYHNIEKYSGLSIEEFRSNPKELIKAAVRLAKAFYDSFSKEDKLKAKEMGITKSGLIGGAWLGGPGGVRKVLNGTGNPSDAHWNKNGKGSNVADCMKRYNNL